MNKSLQASLYAQIERAAERPTLGFINLRGEISWFTWGDIFKQATGYRASLADLGLGRGEVCMLVLPTSEFCAMLLIAVLLQGAVPLFIAPPVVQGQGRHSSLMQILKHMIRKTRPKVVVISDGMKDLRDELGKCSKTIRVVVGSDGLKPDASAAMPLIKPAETDIAAMQLTSGTTGFPRVCVWEQKSVMQALNSMARAMDLNNEDVCLNWTPLYHDMGLVNNFFLCMAKGIPLVMLDPLDFVRKPALWLRGLSDTNSTLTWSPNFGFAIAAERIKNEDLDGVDLGRVRAFWNAAERVHLETINAFNERFASFGLRRDSLRTNYGLAENIGAATFSDPHSAIVVEHLDGSILQEKGIPHSVEQNCESEEDVTVVSVGRPCPGIEIKILSRGGRSLSEGQIGEIALKTPSALTGYLGDRRATRRTLFRNLLRTGDLGYLRHGQLFWVGRVKERITVRGKKLDPSDFERVLFKVPGLRTGCFAVFGVDDLQRGTQRIVIATEVQDGSSYNISDEIRNRVFRELGVMVDDIVMLPKNTLTKTSSGKRRHRHFRKLYLTGSLKPLQVPRAAC